MKKPSKSTSIGSFAFHPNMPEVQEYIKKIASSADRNTHPLESALAAFGAAITIMRECSFTQEQCSEMAKQFHDVVESSASSPPLFDCSIESAGIVSIDPNEDY